MNQMGNYISTAIEKILGIKATEGRENPTMEKNILHPNKLDYCIITCSKNVLSKLTKTQSGIPIPKYLFSLLLRDNTN